jgi:hypothetical protein
MDTQEDALSVFNDAEEILEWVKNYGTISGEHTK